MDLPICWEQGFNLWWFTQVGNTHREDDDSHSIDVLNHIDVWKVALNHIVSSTVGMLPARLPISQSFVHIE